MTPLSQIIDTDAVYQTAVEQLTKDEQLRVRRFAAEGVARYLDSRGSIWKPIAPPAAPAPAAEGR